MTIVERIFSEITKKGKNQSQLARHLNLSRQLVSSWKYGDSFAYYNYINEIAEFLDVSPEYLLGQSKDDKAKPCKLDRKKVEFALNQPEKFDDDVYEDIKKYVSYTSKKYKFKNKAKT